MKDLLKIKSKFFYYLLANNRPALADFGQWLFQPGMLFNSREQWWGDKKPRASAHEGLDLGCFEDRSGRIKSLNGNIRVPAAFAGKIVKIARDFLGKSIYLSHEIFAPDGRQLYTAYGHTTPREWVAAGATVPEGAIIATLAAVSGPKAKIPPHLHITLAFIPPAFPPGRLNWQNLGRDRAITLVDPLVFLFTGFQPE